MKAKVSKMHKEKSTILRQSCDLILLSQNSLLSLQLQFTWDKSFLCPASNNK